MLQDSFSVYKPLSGKFLEEILIEACHSCSFREKSLAFCLQPFLIARTYKRKGNIRCKYNIDIQNYKSNKLNSFSQVALSVN